MSSKVIIGGLFLSATSGANLSFIGGALGGAGGGWRVSGCSNSTCCVRPCCQAGRANLSLIDGAVGGTVGGWRVSGCSGLTCCL